MQEIIWTACGKGKEKDCGITGCCS